MRTKISKEKTYTALAAFFALVLILIVCYFLKDTVLGCHDSFADFVFARMHTFPEWYSHNLEFNLARGRVGFISALVFCLRYFILSTGNYTAIWLLQQIPIWLTVGLIAWVTARKTHPVYGVMFAIFFTTFLQIDTNHNLIDCYPFDFMYGMFIMVLGLYLYDGWLMRIGTKGSLKYLIGSVICYYESMTVYEPFITACLIYALISLYYVLKEHQSITSGIKEFVTRLLPHAAVAVVFMVILELLKIHPVVDTTTVTAVDEYGDFYDFANTWSVFSVSLLPLSNIDNVDIISSFTTLFQGRFLPVFAFGSALGAFFSCLAVKSSDRIKENIKSIDLSLLILGVSGLLYAVFFTVPHAMTANYQMWVRDLHAAGYLTSSMCYFGWALFFSCLISIVINCFAYRRRAVFTVSSLILAFLFLACAEITMNINMIFRARDAVTGQQMSYRGQAFYSFFSSDYAENYAAIQIYMPGFSGLHFDMGFDDGYADFEMDRDVTLTNDLKYFRREAGFYDFSGEFFYDVNCDAAWYTSIMNPQDPASQWVSGGDLVIVSTRPGTYELSYVDPDTGQRQTVSVPMGRMEVYAIHNDKPVDTDSLTISLI